MLGPDTELSPDPEFQSSEQIWTSPIVEANPFLPNTRLQTHTSWLTLRQLGSEVHRMRVNEASLVEGESANWYVFASVYLEGTG